ncbi:MAG: hypothetical protein DMF98_22875, partial [Acidobacteria bacterium]
PIDVPPFARSAMDGYAVIAADIAGATRTTPASLSLLGRIYTGEVSSAIVRHGTCAEIATGAPLPEGADAVVMVEETARPGGERIEIFAPAAAGQNIGRRGEPRHGRSCCRPDHRVAAGIGERGETGHGAIADSGAGPPGATSSTVRSATTEDVEDAEVQS